MDEDEDEGEEGAEGTPSGGAASGGEKHCGCDGECGHHGGYCPERFTPSPEVKAKAFPGNFGWDAFCEACRTAQLELIFPAAVAAGQEEGGDASPGEARASDPVATKRPRPDDPIADGAAAVPRERKRPRLESSAKQLGIAVQVGENIYNKVSKKLYDLK